MDRDTEILKIQIFADTLHAGFAQTISIILTMFFTALAISITLWLELKFNIGFLIGILILIAAITICPFMYSMSKYRKDISSLQDMIDKLNRGESVLSLREKWFL